MQPIFTITKHNNMKKIALVGAALLLAVGAQAQMNVKLGVEAGLNISNVKYEKTGVDFSTFTFKTERVNGDTKLGGKAGVVLDLGFNDNLSLQPGLFYSMKGFKSKEQETIEIPGSVITYDMDISTTYSYLELPINVVYRFGDSYSNTRFMVYAGPYIGYAMGGREKVKLTGPDNIAGIAFSGDSSYSRKISTGNQAPTFDFSDPSNPQVNRGDDIKNIDYGFQIGAGVEMGMGLFFKAQYQMGLSNISNGNITFNSSTFTPEVSSGYAKNWTIGVSVGYYLFNGNNRY